MSTPKHVSRVKSVVPVEMPPPPEDLELHEALAGEFRPGERVVLVGEEPALLRKLEQGGCSVLAVSLRSLSLGTTEVPGSTEAREALGAFRPETVVFTDAWTEVPAADQLLRDVVMLAPQADLVLPFYNLGSASSLLGLLTGTGTLGTPRGATEEQVKRWLAACGLRVRQRRVLQSAQLTECLARDAEKSLRHLFQQLNPDTTAHRLLYWSRHGAAGKEVGPRELTPGLLSVVMRNHSLERLDLLDHALFSLACQDYQPLEIVIASQCRTPQTVEALTRLLEKHRPLCNYTYQVVHEPADTDIRARLVNLGVEAARGQYVAFLDDDDVIYPQHYHNLIAALQKGTEAWAVGRIRRAFFSSGPSGELYCRTKDEMHRGDTFDLAQLIHDNYITCHSYVLDRSRLGRFPVRFAEELSLHEDYAFLLRLCALFRPTLPPGPPSCEYRIRDDGSNSILFGGSESSMQGKQRAWSWSTIIKNASKRSIQMLITEEEFELEMERVRRTTWNIAEQAGRAAASVLKEPRFQLVDKANSLMKQRGPRVHQALKYVVSKLIK